MPTKGALEGGAWHQEARGELIGLKVRDDEIAIAEGKQINLEIGDDPDDYNAYLIPVIGPDDEDDDDGELHLLSEDTVNEIRASLDAAQKTLYGYLDKSFGSYKTPLLTTRLLRHSNPSGTLPTILRRRLTAR